MKKRRARLLLAGLLLSMLTTASLADGTVLEVELPEALPTAGQEFTVTVDLSGNPGFSALQFTLAYDKSQVECTGISSGSLLSGTLSATNPNAADGAIVAAASTGEQTGDGNVVTLTFRAKADLTALDMHMEDLVLCDSEARDIAASVTGVPLTEPEQQTSEPTAQGDTQGSGTAQQTDKAAAPEDNKTPENAKPSEDDETPNKDLTSDPDEDPGDAEAEERQGASVPETGDEAIAWPEDSEPTQVPDQAADQVPAEQETIAAQASVSLFSDLAGHWAEPYVLQAAELGLFKGYDDGRFGPDDQVTRAQFITVLWRMSGSPTPRGLLTPFTDLDGLSAEFRSAIAWGYENGFINGMTATTFEPDGPITREQAMKILFLYSGGISGMETLLSAIYDDAFTDSQDVSDWARAPMYWGIYNCMISGTTSTTLSPQGTATRGQLAKILVTYISTFGT